MRKVELLAPAGSYESAVAGIQNGCNAIYMAGARFGARAFASNFDDEKIIEMVNYAHAYGVKVYITLNTLIHDDECEDCFAYVDFLYHVNVDALIVQDLGVLYYLRTHYPDFEVHASTQMHIVNEAALSFLERIGVTRAVLAREVKLEEIIQFAKHNIELEVFVHGALCVAYSGQCLMSAMIGGRSGNRGECAQTCRMPYTLCDLKLNKDYGRPAYLLSLKDLNTLKHVNELKEAGVASFKIEGRMKKSEYVGHITSLYRKKIDNEQYKISEEEMEMAKVLFHRGYTTGFLKSQMGSHLYNPYRPNHIGIEVGKVLNYQKGRAQIILTHSLKQNDGIRILGGKEDYGFKVNRLYVDGLLANGAQEGMLVEVECHKKVYKDNKVVKTSDPMMDKKIREGYEQISRRVPVSMYVEARSNQKLKLTLSDGQHCVCMSSQQSLEIANKRATTKEEIITQLQKIKDTIFVIKHIEITMNEALFIPIKVINQLRRDAIEKLYEKRSSNIERVERSFQLDEIEVKPVKKQLNAKVLNEQQLLACLSEVDYVYVSDRTLYKQYKQNPKVKLCASRVEKGSYDDVSMIAEIGGIYALEHFECDTSLNVYNAHTLHFLHQMKADFVSLSYELSINDITRLMKQYKAIYQKQCNTQFVAYGRVEVMVSEHCPINAVLLDNDKKNCQLCRKHTYALKDKFNNKFPMRNDSKCRMHLYDFKIRDEIASIPTILESGVKAIRLDFTFEDADEVLEIITKAKTYM